MVGAPFPPHAPGGVIYRVLLALLPPHSPTSTERYRLPTSQSPQASGGHLLLLTESNQQLAALPAPAPTVLCSASNHPPPTPPAGTPPRRPREHKPPVSCCAHNHRPLSPDGSHHRSGIGPTAPPRSQTSQTP